MTSNPPCSPEKFLLKWSTGQCNNIQEKRGIWFCGSYHGYGFLEDGLKVATEADFGFADAYLNGDVSFVDKDEGLLNLFRIILAIQYLYPSNMADKKSIGFKGWWTPMFFTAGIASAKYFYKHICRRNTVTSAR